MSTTRPKSTTLVPTVSQKGVDVGWEEWLARPTKMEDVLFISYLRWKEMCLCVCVGALKICPEVSPGLQWRFYRLVKAEQEAGDVVDFLQLVIVRRSVSSANI